MKNIKFSLIILLALVVSVAGGTLAMAKEKENKGKNAAKIVDITVALTSATSTEATTTPPTSTSTPSTGTTTPPVATTTATTTPPITSTTTPPKTTPSAGAATSTATTTIPVIPKIIGQSGQVNDILADAFFGSNYYSGSGLSVKATRSLAFIGVLCAIIGGALLVSRAISTRRYYS
jgi:hypothetical protein